MQRISEIESSQIYFKAWLVYWKPHQNFKDHSCCLHIAYCTVSYFIRLTTYSTSHSTQKHFKMCSWLFLSEGIPFQNDKNETAPKAL